MVEIVVDEGGAGKRVGGVYRRGTTSPLFWRLAKIRGPVNFPRGEGLFNAGIAGRPSDMNENDERGVARFTLRRVRSSTAKTARRWSRLQGAIRLDIYIYLVEFLALRRLRIFFSRYFGFRLARDTVNREHAKFLIGEKVWRFFPFFFLRREK